jgi:methionyl-tRNA synthetase
MSKTFQRYTITAALPYANGPVHIGHLAGVYIPADIYARYQRLRGRDLVFVCGSDEHGVPVTIRAQKEGMSVQEVVDKYHQLIKNSFEQFGISFDIYSRTSSPLHHEVAAAFFKKLYDEGKLIEKVTEQFYDPEAGQFLADRYIQGTCPKCGYENAYGDQCERCGSTLSPEELLNPRSMLSGAQPVKKATKHWYLPLNEYENWLRQWILEEHRHDWKTNVYGQCKSWIDAGLQPRAVTRDLDWGVKVPVEGAEGKVLYVWFDAPIGYISATMEYFRQKGEADKWKDYWQKEDTRLIHFIGKDNIVFHCIIFPVMLKAHGGYILPDNVPANEFLNLENEKISTSRNWAVWLHEYLEDFPGKQDVLRYVLTANAPETKDNNFTWKDFQEKNNSELVANIGNLVNRVFVLTHKFFEGKVPAASQPTGDDQVLIDAIRQYPEKIAQAVEQFHFREGLQELMNFARVANKYLTDQEPWKLFKTNPERTATVLHYCLQMIGNWAILAQPFLPFTAQKLLQALAMEGACSWEQAGNPQLLAEGTPVQKIGHLFEKIEDEVIQKQIEKLKSTSQNNQDIAQGNSYKDTIQYEDFAKLDIRIGTIREAEKLPKSKKLLKLSVDMGNGEVRTILSGIAEHFSAEEVVGKQVCVLANLAPRKMMGVESQGMVLMAEDKDGRLVFVSPEAVVQAGAVVS